MAIPPGFTDQGLKKALYRLKQSPRAWFKKFSKAILALGYTRNNADHTSFVRKQYEITAIIVYADNIIITGDMEEISKVKRYC